MGREMHSLITIFVLFKRVALADYFIQLTDPKTGPIFKEKIFPRFETPSTVFGSANSISNLNLDGAVKILDWSYGIENLITFNGASGVGLGKASLGALSISRNSDAYSPFLFQYNTKPSVLTLTLAVTSGVGRGAVQLSALYKFSTVYVGSFQQKAGDSGPAMEVLSLEYGQFSMLVGAFGPDGKISKVNTWGWDKITNRQL